MVFTRRGFAGGRVTRDFGGFFDVVSMSALPLGDGRALRDGDRGHVSASDPRGILGDCPLLAACLTPTDLAHARQVQAGRAARRSPGALAPAVRDSLIYPAVPTGRQPIRNHPPPPPLHS